MMNGIVLLAMVTMAEVVAVTLAEIVQAYSTSRYQLRHPEFGVFISKQTPRSSLRPVNHTTLPLFPQRPLRIQEEGCR